MVVKLCSILEIPLITEKVVSADLFLNTMNRQQTICEHDAAKFSPTDFELSNPQKKQESWMSLKFKLDSW